MGFAPPLHQNFLVQRPWKRHVQTAVVRGMQVRKFPTPLESAIGPARQRLVEVKGARAWNRHQALAHAHARKRLGAHEQLLLHVRRGDLRDLLVWLGMFSRRTGRVGFWPQPLRDLKAYPLFHLLLVRFGSLFEEE